MATKTKSTKTKFSKETSKKLALVRGDALNPSADHVPAIVRADTLSTKGFIVKEGFIVKSRSPMIKPAALKKGDAITGVFTKIITCVAGKNDDGTDKPGNLIELVPRGAQVGVAFPVTAVIRGALDITGVGDKAESPHLGKEVIIQALGEENKIPSKKGQDAWNFIVAIK